MMMAMHGHTRGNPPAQQMGPAPPIIITITIAITITITIIITIIIIIIIIILPYTRKLQGWNPPILPARIRAARRRGAADCECTVIFQHTTVHDDHRIQYTSISPGTGGPGTGGNRPASSPPPASAASRQTRRKEGVYLYISLCICIYIIMHNLFGAAPTSGRRRRAAAGPPGGRLREEGPLPRERPGRGARGRRRGP